MEFLLQMHSGIQRNDFDYLNSSVAFYLCDYMLGKNTQKTKKTKNLSPASQKRNLERHKNF